MPITFTYDLEDSRSDLSRPVRFEVMTDEVLAFLADLRVTATFFIVGELAESHPELVRRIADAGHEVALHGFRHIPLTKLDPVAFAEDLRRGTAALEDASGGAVRGYRAPIFSLTPATAWAVEALTNAGFTYSSSVLPAANPLNGWPGAPDGAFRWSTGLVELPCPVAGRGRLSVPFLGGAYLRYLPLRVVRRLARRADEPGRTDWIYCHPYDFDTEEEFDVLPQASRLTSHILHRRRGGTFERIAATLVAGGGPAAPLGAIADRLARDASLPRVVASGAPAAVAG